MATFLELQTNVQAFVIDLPPTVTAAVPRLVNDAIRSVQRKYNFKEMEQLVVFPTVANTITLGNITNFKEYRDQGPYVYNNTTRARKLTTTTGPDAHMAIFQTQPGRPELISFGISGTTTTYTFSIYPYPDTNSDFADGNYQIVIPYYGFTASLVNSSDTNWFTNNMDDYIIEKAVGEAFGLDWDNDNMAIHLQRADEKFKEAKKADKTKRIAGVNELAVLWQGGRTPPVRW